MPVKRSKDQVRVSKLKKVSF